MVGSSTASAPSARSREASASDCSRARVTTMRLPNNGSRSYQFLSVVFGTSIGVDDGRALAGKILEQAGADGLNDLPDRARVIVGRDADEKVDLTYVHQLAKKIIVKDGLFGQNSPPASAWKNATEFKAISHAKPAP